MENIYENDTYVKILDKFNLNSRSENSLKELSNWIYAITIGICALLISQFGNLDFSKLPYYVKVYYKILVGLSMINVLLASYNYYSLLNRSMIMNAKEADLRKFKINVDEQRKDKKELNEQEVNNLIKEIEIITKDWLDAHNKINNIGQMSKVTLIITCITVIAIGVFILVVI